MLNLGQIVYFIDIIRIGNITEARMYYGRIISQSFISDYGDEPKVFYNIEVEYACFGHRFETRIFENVEQMYIFFDEKEAEKYKNKLNADFKRQRNKLKKLKLDILLDDENLKDKDLKDGLKYLLDKELIKINN